MQAGQPYPPLNIDNRPETANTRLDYTQEDWHSWCHYSFRTHCLPQKDKQAGTSLQTNAWRHLDTRITSMERILRVIVNNWYLKLWTTMVHSILYFIDNQKCSPNRNITVSMAKLCFQWTIALGWIHWTKSFVFAFITRLNSVYMYNVLSRHYLSIFYMMFLIIA